MVVGRLWWGSVLPLEHAAGPKPVGSLLRRRAGASALATGRVM